MVSETDAGLVERLTIDDAIMFMETACRNWENFAINHDDADDMRVALEAFRKQSITEAAARITALEAEVARLREAAEGAVHFSDAVAYRNDALSRSLRGWLAELSRALGQQP